MAACWPISTDKIRVPCAENDERRPHTRGDCRAHCAPESWHIYHNTLTVIVRKDVPPNCVHFPCRKQRSIKAMSVHLVQEAPCLFSFLPPSLRPLLAPMPVGKSDEIGP